MINHEVITITHYYQTIGKQGLLLSNIDVHPSNKGEVFLTVNTNCIVANHIP